MEMYDFFHPRKSTLETLLLVVSNMWCSYMSDIHYKVLILIKSTASGQEQQFCKSGASVRIYMINMVANIL